MGYAPISSSGAEQVAIIHCPVVKAGKVWVASRKMAKGNICTPAGRLSGGPAGRSTGGPAHQVVKSVGLTLLFLFSL